ncbi:MAG: hypothetical protein Q7S31_03185 [bacterium]|nr:hypothetical protein [bacterium]
MEIIPAILTDDPLEMDGWLRKVRDSRKFNRVQIDFIDGEYAKNITFKPMETDIIPFLPLKFDAHLMVTENNILEWSLMARKFGFDRVIAQMESLSHPEEYDCLGFDFHAPIEQIKPYLPNLKLVVVMAVEPGFGGQEFMSAAKDDVQKLAQLRDEHDYKYHICVDGGIEKEHLEELEKLGADEAAVGVKRILEW